MSPEHRPELRVQLDFTPGDPKRTSHPNVVPRSDAAAADPAARKPSRTRKRRTETSTNGMVCTINGLPMQGYPFCWLTGGCWSYWVGWVSGFTDYVPGADVVASWRTPVNAVGAYNTDLVVLGNGGRITMTFDLRAVGVVNQATA